VSLEAFFGVGEMTKSLIVRIPSLFASSGETLRKISDYENGSCFFGFDAGFGCLSEVIFDLPNFARRPS
jgi:hypothetical protein